MNDTATEPMTNKPLSAEEILTYLKDHPAFLEENPEACDLLVSPKMQDGKKIKDFQSYMIERLKSDKNEAIETTKEVVTTVRNNMNNQARVHRAILRLVEASSFENFVNVITMDLSTMLDVDITVLLVESNGDDIPHIHTNGIRVLPQGTIDKWLGKKDSLLESDIQGVEAIYGGGSTLVKSQALVRVDISMDTPPALMVFGSRDPNLFQDGQATEQITFLARIVERMFRLWLNIPV
jgi:uncharacterized protein YigA (DUF484 family)